MAIPKAGAFGCLLLGTLKASPLIEATHQNNLLKVEALIKGGAAVNEANRYGVTPLSLACQNGNPEMVEQLLKAGADANLTLPGDESPLHTASRTGKLECVKLLLNAGAKLDAREHREQTPLMWAAADGHAEVVRYLLEKGAEFKKPLASGYTPLLFAVRQGHSDVAKALIEKGADVNEAAKVKKGRKRMSDGTSALILAVENGHFELASYLLTMGANANDLRSGYAPLHVLSWVRKSVKGDGDDGLPTPQGSGDLTSLELVKILVKHGADPNLKLGGGGPRGTARVDRKEATPYLLAAQTADLPFLKVLEEVGADPSLANHCGTTPLLAAAGMGVTAPGEEAADLKSALEVVRYLVMQGADINVKDDRGETVMHAAAYKSAPKMMALLDELGADIKMWHQKNKSGWTPLKITQGYRPGNFRPIEKSERALVVIMRKRGVAPE
ncbi:MAG: ankyrin repeat domain-containing protein [Akkermansiaceae bacterium]